MIVINFFDKTGIQAATADITQATLPDIAELLKIQEMLGRTWEYQKN